MTTNKTTYFNSSTYSINRLIKTKLRKPLVLLLGLSVFTCSSVTCHANDIGHQRRGSISRIKESTQVKMTEQELKKNFVLYESLCQKTKTYLGNRWLFNRRLNDEQETILREADSFFRNKEKQKLLDAFKKNPSECSGEKKKIRQEFLGHMKAFQKLNEN